MLPLRPQLAKVKVPAYGKLKIIIYKHHKTYQTKMKKQNGYLQLQE
jgi:hypothetical protein